MFELALKKEMRSLSQAALVAFGTGLVVLAARGFIEDLRSADRADIDAATNIPATIIEGVDVDARDQPLQVGAIPGLEGVVTEEQAFDTLCACLPRVRPPVIGQLMHELRLWGLSATFSDDALSQPWSGVEAADILLSDKLCRERTFPKGGNLLLDSPFGIRAVAWGSPDAVLKGGEGHHGQLLKVLAEVGAPLSTRVETESGRVGTIADILRDATMRFTLNGELEFMATALALTLPPERGWTDRFGVRHTFDDLVENLLLEPYGKGSCCGCHKPYALINILRCDEQYPILSAESRTAALAWLARLSKLLERSERPEGGWDASWAGTEHSRAGFGDDLLDRITVIGHHLEWIALAPSSVRPERDVVQRAVIALRTDVEAMPMRARSFWKSVLPLSHAARALCLLHGSEPYRLWTEGRDARKLRAVAHPARKDAQVIVPSVVVSN